VRESDRELLPAVWSELAPELARLACALGVDASRAEDALQDVYLAAHQKQPCRADRAGLRRWLYRVLVNRCNLEHRRRTRRSRMMRRVHTRSSNSGHADDASQDACRQEERELVRRALDGLEPPLRSVLVLRYFAELDSKEIGRILEVPDSTVRSRLRTARGRLAQALREMGPDNDSPDLRHG
jgi:RNA polymerase sigma-70 factor (ECF subfamily)